MNIDDDDNGDGYDEAIFFDKNLYDCCCYHYPGHYWHNVECFLFCFQNILPEYIWNRESNVNVTRITKKCNETQNETCRRKIRQTILCMI